MNPSARAMATGQKDVGLRTAWLALAVLVATMVGFAAATAYSRRIAARLNDDAISIAINASPSIEHLSAAREEVLRLALVATSAAEPSSVYTVTSERGPFTSALSRLEQDISAYVAQPFYPGEPARYAGAARKLDALKVAVSEVSAALDRGDGSAARALLHQVLIPGAQSADGALRELVEFNAEQQHRLAMEIPRQLSHGNRVGYILQLLAAVLGLILMGLVVRAIHQYGRLLRMRQRQAAEHARDVVAFGAKLESIIEASVNISKAIATTGDTNQIFQTIADRSRIVVNAQYCAVGCGTDPERPYDPWVTSGMPAPVVAALGHPPRPDGLLGAVECARRPIRLRDPRAHPAFRGLPPGHPALGPFLGVPIVRAEQNIGNLYLARTPEQPPFTEEDERAAELLAGFLSVAIVNAQLYKAALAATQAREDLLAMVSHDLKNPLNAIRLSTEVLRRRATGDGTLEGPLDRIERSSERMGRLISDLLDAAKIEAGAFQAVRRPEEVASLLASAVESLRGAAAKKSISIGVTAPEAPVNVLCERNLILRVLANLLGNAVKFSPEQATIAVTAALNDGAVQFSVTDEGPGIPAEDIPHVFDRYWQQSDGDRRGSGLGLYIAKGIVEAHGGRIWIESTPGQGTNVIFTLAAVRPIDARTSTESLTT